MNNDDDWFNTDMMHEGFYKGLLTVSSYVNKRWKLIEGYTCKLETADRDAAMQTLYLRAAAWLQTVERLPHPVCFQGVLAARRGLLEILVDLILLHYDKTNATGWKMHWWAKSERMKVCEETVDFYHSRGLPVPDVHSDREAAYLRDKGSIDHKRITLWPTKNGNPKHPKRWTGHTRTFAEDLRDADAFHGSVIKGDLGVTLEELYFTEYRGLSWQIHSGLAGVMDLPPKAFVINSALAFRQCADFGMSIAKIVLSDFGFTEQLPILRDEWQQIEKVRVLNFVDVKASRKRD